MSEAIRPAPRARPARTAGARPWPILAAVLALVAGAATAVVIVTRSEPPAAPRATPQVAGPPTTGQPTGEAAPGPGGPSVTPLPSGRLRIVARPERVEVFVGGEPVGWTPTELTLPAGTHHVRLGLAGHTSAEGDVVIEPSSLASLSWSLTPEPASAATAGGAAAKVARPGSPSRPGATGKRTPGGTSSPAPPPVDAAPPVERTVPPPPPPPIKAEPKQPPPPPSGLPTKSNPYGPPAR